MPKPNPGDLIAYIQISYYASGEMSVSGNIGDKRLALQLLDHAKDAVNNQLRPEDQLVIPNKDVVIAQHENYPTLPAGDLCRAKS
jgi:hypothetical protein